MPIDGDGAKQSRRMPSHITALIDLQEWQHDPGALEEVSHRGGEPTQNTEEKNQNQYTQNFTDLTLRYKKCMKLRTWMSSDSSHPLWQFSAPEVWSRANAATSVNVLENCTHCLELLLTRNLLFIKQRIILRDLVQGYLLDSCCFFKAVKHEWRKG